MTNSSFVTMISQASQDSPLPDPPQIRGMLFSGNLPSASLLRMRRRRASWSMAAFREWRTHDQATFTGVWRSASVSPKGRGAGNSKVTAPGWLRWSEMNRPSFVGYSYPIRVY
jgi:hypothetical protein